MEQCDIVNMNEYENIEEMVSDVFDPMNEKKIKSVVIIYE